MLKPRKAGTTVNDVTGATCPGGRPSRARRRPTRGRPTRGGRRARTTRGGRRAADGKRARARKADGHEAANVIYRTEPLTVNTLSTRRCTEPPEHYTRFIHDVTGNRQGSVPVPPARPGAVCGGRAGGVGGA
ncbi:hypothetical protein EVAR_61713_1 [Eumeta japonica]|uniref:Uncharacterized protein n=1 Tax=Eumeta variegata TaxID=151549 RepID=A0A4C1ZQ60_EUMVA|nr:hypothetical protein EVAR_61713_1 [Eumeta japonica]